ncbi:hypothetical protein [Phenylobacterium aquaticum]|uniref:hypothetical protein n=1 Tax=Phenylobacterium aquaticum TaxID=1763816 RepID=UPI0026EEAFFA|nr:hypothetical protein [Phenylobacterium aquaticum]
MSARALHPAGLAALALTLGLAACDRPAPRRPHLAAPPPGVAEFGLSAVGAPLAPVAPPAIPAPAAAAPVTWDRANQVFLFKGQPLRAEKLWTFEGATDGFVATGGEVAPADGLGMTYREVGADPILRSPRGLNVDGHVRTLVLVRVVRTLAGTGWDGTLYYATPGHKESAAFHAKPVFGGDPPLNTPTVLIFDMKHPAAGGADWTSSLIDQIRIDLDATGGGEFIVRQVAIAQDPGGLIPEPAAAKP